MKKLALVALALAAAPLLLAAAPEAAPAVPSIEAPAALTQTAENPPEAAKVDLETLFHETAIIACLDSGIPCLRNRDCVSVCYPLVCACAGTCVYCP